MVDWARSGKLQGGRPKERGISRGRPKRRVTAKRRDHAGNGVRSGPYPGHSRPRRGKESIAFFGFSFALSTNVVLIVGSGNLVHNLHTYAWGRHAVDPFEWAVRFEQEARGLLLSGDHKPLIHYERLGSDATLSVPTPDHFLPLLYVIGSGAAHERLTFPVEGVDGGSISMLTVQLG